MSGMRGRRRSDLETTVRAAGVVALAAGLFWVESLLPGRAVPWGSVSELDVSSEDCEERREERQAGSFTLNPRHPEPVPWRDVATWFRLDPVEVCSVNGVRAAECAERRLAPGDELTIPLRHHAPGPPGRLRPGEGRGR